MTSSFGLSFAPFLPWQALAAIAAVAALLALWGIFRRVRGAWLRGLALLLALAALTNPSLTREERERLPNVVAVVVDRSASQRLGDREAMTEETRAELEQRLAGLPNTEVRWIDAGGDPLSSDGTELFNALSRGLADVPVERIGGAILVTDGVVHDIPAEASALGFNAPVHALITGHPDDRDRRIALETAPRFAIVGKDQPIAFRVLEEGPADNGPVGITVRRNGEELGRITVIPSERAELPIPIENPGSNVVEIEADAAPGELTTVNNRAVLPIEGVREKMRVLLVSGEPHTGERVWRNLLKADASVDLVHFTILRPPEKQDGTPINELSLIAFPTRELFATKIEEFDLIIFDRYSRQSILPMIYFDNIARFVREGGAVLLAAGPDYAQGGSLYDTPLGDVLPAAPTGEVIEEPFRAQISEEGRRHPVTRGLPGGEENPPRWSRWFRHIGAEVRDGETVMEAPGNAPLMVLSREGEGRVAALLSDHIWLWSRGFEGGGPHQEMLRRLAHWLLKVPALEEEALRASARGTSITVERQTLAEQAEPVTVAAPDGSTTTVTLTEDEPGLWRGRLEAQGFGLHRVTSGDLTAFANVGPPNPREYLEVASTEQRLSPLLQDTGGTVRRLAGSDGIELPRISATRPGARQGGDDWIGLALPNISVARGLEVYPLFAGVIGLTLLLGALAAAWAREGR
ncbi:membrane protein [Agaricicola taiwanensis]|uniref:Membrane protein n=1 Tax=Agaricicola taiwanensis TaxID=591372 RepID=A0A8J2VNH1_9RHOB|nr:hypothetical protein [Agaricicola taiwanensis]GGE39955.1 membrane protein [Agaricicola taiwanensis]